MAFMVASNILYQYPILNLKLFGRILYLHKNSLHKSHLLRISNTDEVFQKAKLFTLNTGVQLPKLTI